MADDDLIIVTCVATGKEYSLNKHELKLPPEAGAANPWEVVEGLLDGSIKYLSEEARENGWAWMSDLHTWRPHELPEYRAVRHHDDDVLMRHLKYFRKPGDLGDSRMIDD